MHYDNKTYICTYYNSLTKSKKKKGLKKLKKCEFLFSDKNNLQTSHAKNNN